MLRQLARPAPMHTSFVELRDSPLLKAPVRISGEYRRPDDAGSVREVQSPDAQTPRNRTGLRAHPGGRRPMRVRAFQAIRSPNRFRARAA